MNSRTVGILEVAAAAIIWGSEGVFVNLIPLTSYAIALFRTIFASMTVATGILIAKRLQYFRPGSHLSRLLALGFFLCVGSVFLFEALKTLPIAQAVLLNYMAPIFVAILATAFLKENVARRASAALALSFAGIIIMVISNGKGEGFNLLGSILGLSAGLAHAIFMILSKETLTKVSNYTIVLYSNLVASVLLAPSAMNIQLNLRWEDWSMLLTLGIVNTALAIFLFYRGLGKIRAHEAAIITYLEPVSAAFLGTIFLNQVPKLETIIGGCLVIIGGYIVMTKKIP